MPKRKRKRPSIGFYKSVEELPNDILRDVLDDKVELHTIRVDWSASRAELMDFFMKFLKSARKRRKK